MEKYFEEIKQRALRTINQNGYPTQKPINNYKSELALELKVLVPSLDTKRVTTDFGTELMIHSTAPVGLSYVPGERMDFADIAVPVINNNSVVLNHIFPQLSSMRFGNIGNQPYFIYRQYGRNLQTDENAQKEIREKAKIYFNAIENRLSEARVAAENFYENVLLPLIDEKMEELKKSKDLKEEAKKKINPFA